MKRPESYSESVLRQAEEARERGKGPGAKPPAEGLRGARGQRKRPRYPSEARRQRLTFDIDLAPEVADLLRAMAANEDGSLYGEGPIRLGDLATTALAVGLLELAEGGPELTVKWAVRSWGGRCVEWPQSLKTKVWTLVRRSEKGADK